MLSFLIAARIMFLSPMMTPMSSRSPWETKVTLSNLSDRKSSKNHREFGLEGRQEEKKRTYRDNDNARRLHDHLLHQFVKSITYYWNLLIWIDRRIYTPPHTSRWACCQEICGKPSFSTYRFMPREANQSVTFTVEAQDGGSWSHHVQWNSKKIILLVKDPGVSVMYAECNKNKIDRR